jgi:hypothetical protein
MSLLEQIQRIKVEKKQAIDDERNRCFNEVERLKEELRYKESQLNCALSEIDQFKQKMSEYSLIDKKIVELEELQTKLIEDNDQLQSKIDARVKPIKELERLGENIVIPFEFDMIL